MGVAGSGVPSIDESFKRFVELGRVCVVNYGPDEGKLCVIVNVVDQARAMVDGPSTLTGVTRQAINFKRLSLTDIVVPGVTPGMKLQALTKKFTANKVAEKWAATPEAKKKARQMARASLTDFDRFKVMVAKKVKRDAVGAVGAKPKAAPKAKAAAPKATAAADAKSKGKK